MPPKKSQKELEEEQRAQEEAQRAAEAEAARLAEEAENVLKFIVCWTMSDSS